ncbi:MAG: HXXEE domain-containing protein [Bacillota bacterium]
MVSQPLRLLAFWFLLTGSKFINGLTHLLWTSLLLQYQPGVVTAALFNIPFSIVYFKKLLSGGHMSKTKLFYTLVASTLLYPPATAFTLYLGKVVSNTVNL